MMVAVGAEHSCRDAEVYQHVSAILNNIDTVVDLYQPHPSRQDLLKECKQALTREIESARQTLTREVDFAIADQLFKHWVLLIFGTLLLTLLLALLGIAIWFSQKVSAAQQQLTKMQEQVNEAQLAFTPKRRSSTNLAKRREKIS